MKIFLIKKCDYYQNIDKKYFIKHTPVQFIWIVFEDHTSIAIYDELHTFPSKLYFKTGVTDTYRFFGPLLKEQVDKVINHNILKFKRSGTTKTYTNDMVDETIIKIITTNGELDVMFCCCHDGDCQPPTICYQRLPVEYYKKIVLNKLAN